MIEALQGCRNPMRSLLLLLAAAIASGVLVGGSAVLGICATVFMINA